MTRTWWRAGAFWAVVLIGAAAAFGCGGSGSTTPSPGAYPSVATGSATAAATSAASAPPIDAGATEAPGDTPSSGGAHCGTERWPVKTLSDSDAARVNFNPVPATVTELRALPAPGSLPQSSRIAPTELTTFSVTATAVEFKIETDRDIHLVIADPNDPSATMIVELPNAADCSGAVASAHRASMETARRTLINTFGQPSSSYTRITGSVTITGVGFFDFKHGQTGVAPNAIELHPVLSVASGTSAPPPNTSVPSPLPPDNAPPASASGVTFTSVIGAPPGGVASATVQTSAGASCSISYVTPAGTQSKAQGLFPKTAAGGGTVSWSWNIGSRTRPGTGTVTVTCGGASASAAITIG